MMHSKKPPAPLLLAIHVFIAFIALAMLTVLGGCCKKDVIRDVGIEIAEASDIAKMQFERCRAENNDTACEDVVKKLDGIEKLATELQEKASE